MEWTENIYPSVNEQKKYKSGAFCLKVFESAYFLLNH